MSDEREFQDAEFTEAQLQMLRDKAKALPAEITPNPMAWASIRDRIESSRVHEFPTQQVRQKRNVVTRNVMLAAASLFVVITSVVVLRERDERPTVASTPDSSDVASPAPVVDAPVSLASAPVDTTVAVAPRRLSPPVVAVLAQYNAAALDLTRDLDARRPRLQADALAVVDSCLHTIDQAIQESRAALVDAPDNPIIVELLQLTYKQKLDLLRRAADLPTGSL